MINSSARIRHFFAKSAQLAEFNLRLLLFPAFAGIIHKKDYKTARRLLQALARINNVITPRVALRYVFRKSSGRTPGAFFCPRISEAARRGARRAAP